MRAAEAIQVRLNRPVSAIPINGETGKAGTVDLQSERQPELPRELLAEEEARRHVRQLLNDSLHLNILKTLGRHPDPLAFFRHRSTWGIALGQMGYLYALGVFVSWLPGCLVLER
jgi:hypothetical protein